MTMIGRTKKDWAWLGKQALMGNHGNRPIILSAGPKGKLMQRGPEGLMIEIDPKHPDMRAIAGAARLIEAVEAFMRLRTTLFPNVHGAPECAALKELEEALKDSGGEVPYEA